jgi:hypothetical protein
MDKLIITNYSGFDPEVNTDKTLNESLLWNRFSYPRSKVAVLGLNVTFKIINDENNNLVKGISMLRYSFFEYWLH